MTNSLLSLYGELRILIIFCPYLVTIYLTPSISHFYITVWIWITNLAIYKDSECVPNSMILHYLMSRTISYFRTAACACGWCTISKLWTMVCSLVTLWSLFRDFLLMSLCFSNCLWKTKQSDKLLFCSQEKECFIYLPLTVNNAMEETILNGWMP